jgi:hypothetical protein
MPKIAELRMIDGVMWARLDVDWKKDEQVSLLTEPEVQAIRKDEREACVWAVDNCSLLNEEEKNVTRQAIRGFTISRGID